MDFHLSLSANIVLFRCELQDGTFQLISIPHVLRKSTFCLYDVMGSREQLTDVHLSTNMTTLHQSEAPFVGEWVFRIEGFRGKGYEFPRARTGTDYGQSSSFSTGTFAMQATNKHTPACYRC